MVSVMFLVEFLISTKLLTEQGKCTNGCKRNQAKCDVDTIYDFKMKRNKHVWAEADDHVE